MLVPGGHYFVVSYGKPESRSSHFIRGFLSWERREFILYEPNTQKEKEKEKEEDKEEEEDNKTHYIYVCTKNDDANEVSEKYFDIEFENLMEEKYLKLLEMELEV